MDSEQYVVAAREGSDEGLYGDAGAVEGVGVTIVMGFAFLGDVGVVDEGLAVGKGRGVIAWHLGEDGPDEEAVAVVADNLVRDFLEEGAAGEGAEELARGGVAGVCDGGVVGDRVLGHGVGTYPPKLAAATRSIGMARTASAVSALIRTFTRAALAVSRMYRSSMVGSKSRSV